MKYYGKSPPKLNLYKVIYQNHHLGYYWAENQQELDEKINGRSVTSVEQIV